MSQHDYVVVPNLGGFIVQMQSAKLLSDRITPPHATIGFNALLNNADGLLAIEISRAEQISYRKAVEYIDTKVEYINTQLNANGNIIIGDLGILQKNDSGSLTFNPVYKSNFLPQNIGLSDLYIAPKEVHVVKEHRNITISMPSNKMVKFAVAAMLLLGLFLVSPRITDVRQTDYASLVSLPFVHSLEDPNNQNVEIKTAEIKAAKTEKVEKKKSDIVEPIKTATQKTDDVDNYHVIVASLPSQESAQRFCDELIKDKFAKAHVLSHSKKMYRVSIQSFSSNEKANSYMQSLRKADSRFESAWVFNE